MYWLRWHYYIKVIATALHRNNKKVRSGDNRYSRPDCNKKKRQKAVKVKVTKNGWWCWCMWCKQEQIRIGLIIIIIITRNTFCQTRSLSNATISVLITWRSSSSKSAVVFKISSKSDDFSPRYGDIMIFKMAAVRHLGTVLPPYKTTHEVSVVWPQLPVKFYVNLIHRSEDIAI